MGSKAFKHNIHNMSLVKSMWDVAQMTVELVSSEKLVQLKEDFSACS